jgi:hypothetical protein
LNSQQKKENNKMSITIEQSDNAIRETFYSMECGIEYVLNDHWFAEVNRFRKEQHCSILKGKKEYILIRKVQKLVLNGKEIFDFKDKTNLSLAFAFFVSGSVGVVIQCNGIEKLETVNTCEGKVVEIDGRKYKLTLA